MATQPISRWSTKRIDAAVTLWTRRNNYAAAQLTRARKIRVTVTPRSKVSAAQKRASIIKWTRAQHTAMRLLAAFKAEQKRRTPQSLGERAWIAAGRDLGIMEHGGNNRGPQVERIIRANGGTPGEAWCGDAVASWYITAGSKAVVRSWAAVRLLGYLTGQVITSNPKRGDIVKYDFDHTGLFGYYSDANGRMVPKSQATHIVAREGNTGASGAVSDSATGGDGVYQKIRARSLVHQYVRVTR